MTQIVIPNADPVETLTFESVVTVDISSFTNSQDYISLSLPEYQGTKLTASRCFVDFTSHPEGNFGLGPTDALAFSAAVTPPPATAGTDIELRFLISQLAMVDKSAITGVRFRLWATTATTFRCLSIRACAVDWVYAPIDLDTLWHRVKHPPSPAGGISYAGKGFPSLEDFPSESLFPFETPFNAWPIVFRSGALSGVTDPAPVNVKIGATFTAGSFAQATGKAGEASYNQIALYFRDVPTDDQTMVEMDTFHQSQLDAIGHQPDFGKALYRSRSQKELDIEDQTELDAETQFALERRPDETEHSWLEVKLTWSALGTGKYKGEWNSATTYAIGTYVYKAGTYYVGIKTGNTNKTPPNAEYWTVVTSPIMNNNLTIKDADGTGYTFENVPIEASEAIDLEKGNYVMLVELEDNRFRVEIYPVNQVGQIVGETLTFDTGNIVDDNLFKRRKGRIGWWAQLPDGDAYMHSIRTRGINFGEVVSKEFQSVTPVKGATVFSGSSSDVELVTILVATDPVNTTVSPDPSVSATGKALKVVTTPGVSLQGVTSNTFFIDDPSNLRMSFDINFPSSEIPGGGLSAFLLGPYSQVIPLEITHFDKDTWSHVKVALKSALFQTGGYRFVLMQSLPVVSTTWWVENLSVKTAAVKWWARAYAPDPWSEPDERWQPVGYTLNSLNGGVVFEDTGNGLQVKAQALRQDASISEFKVVPQYATLGNLVWPELTRTNVAPTSVEIEKTVEERTVTFIGKATDSDGYLINFNWEFGDDHYDNGPKVIHTYKRAGTYKVTLLVSDDFGATSSQQVSVTVT